ncbi:MAG: hypothetical protein Q7R76_04190 [Candidatus Woesearchaeota archaeon]|nr:hypothetical protein [Candidatus Woesearchaeota archaeon]
MKQQHTHHHHNVNHAPDKHAQHPKKHPLGKYFVPLLLIISLFALYVIWQDEINALTGRVAYGVGLTDGALDTLSGALAAPPNLGALRNLPPLNVQPKKNVGEACTANTNCTSNSCIGNLCSDAPIALPGASLPGGVAAGVAAAVQRAQAPAPQPAPQPNPLAGLRVPANLPGAGASAPAPAQQPAQPAASSLPGLGGLGAQAQALAQRVPAPAPAVISPSPSIGQSFLPAELLDYVRQHSVELPVPTCTGPGCSVVAFSCDKQNLNLIQKVATPCATTCTDGVCPQVDVVAKQPAAVAPPVAGCDDDNTLKSHIKEGHGKGKKQTAEDLMKTIKKWRKDKKDPKCKK